MMTVTSGTKVTDIMMIPFRLRACCVVCNLQPTSMSMIENIFSLSVFGATFPKPTEIRPVKQK